MSLLIWQIDAFTDRPFHGNPAGVCWYKDSDHLTDARMQSIAREMNLSETAFIRQVDTAQFEIRFFTPSVEVALCGHATLASAHLIHERTGYTEINFSAGHTAIPVTIENETITFAFPAVFTESIDWDDYRLLPMHPEDVIDIRFAADAKVLLVELSDLDALHRLTAFGAFHHDPPIEGVLFTVADGATYDFQSRCFWPWLGIAEDPVTGFAHSILGPYWADKLGKMELNAYQASMRGGAIGIQIDGSSVHLSGSAKTVLRGEILV